MDMQALLASAKLPEKEVRICLRADLLVEYEAAEAALAEAQKHASDSLGAGEGVEAAAQRVVDLGDEMAAASAVFRLRAVGRRRWTALYAEHPPRPDDKRDAMTGFNRDSFFDALVKACIVDPQMSDGQWEQLAELLSAAQWDALVEAAWDVNQAGVDVPFSSAASRALNRTDPASERPTSSESLSSDSTAGSRSPRTSTTSKAASPRRSPKQSGTPNSRR